MNIHFFIFWFFASVFEFFLRIFDAILSEFRDKFQKMMTFVDNSISFAKTNRKIAEISGIYENYCSLFSLLFIIFHYYSSIHYFHYYSLLFVRLLGRNTSPPWYPQEQEATCRGRSSSPMQSGCSTAKPSPRRSLPPNSGHGSRLGRRRCSASPRPPTRSKRGLFNTLLERPCTVRIKSVQNTSISRSFQIWLEFNFWKFVKISANCSTCG